MTKGKGGRDGELGSGICATAVRGIDTFFELWNITYATFSDRGVRSGTCTVRVRSCQFAQSERALRAARAVLASNSRPVQLRLAADHSAHLLRPVLLGGGFRSRQRHSHSHVVSVRRFLLYQIQGGPE